MSEYTPSTAQVRRSYDGQWDVSSPHGADAAAEFDRWLAAHDAKVRAEALRDATLALVEQQRIANLISYYNGENPIPEPASTEIRKALGL